MNTMRMPGCPTYSGPRHEAVPDAGDITSLLRLDDLVQPETPPSWTLDASLTEGHVGRDALGILPESRPSLLPGGPHIGGVAPTARQPVCRGS